MTTEDVKHDKGNTDRRNPDNYIIVEIYQFWRLSDVEIIELINGIPHTNYFNLTSEYGRRSADEEFDFVLNKNRRKIRKIRLTQEEMFNNRNWLEDGLNDNRPTKTKVIRWLKFAFFRLWSLMGWPLLYWADKINARRQRRK